MSRSRILRERVAGQSAMAEVVEAQNAAPERSRIARLFGSSPLAASVRPAYRSALSELMVGDTLESLGGRWDVLHDLPLLDGMLDHLAIGPAGVYAVSVANFSDRDVVVDGDALLVVGETDPALEEARWKADAAASVLSGAAGRTVPVHALLVIVEARRLVVKSPADTVEVVALSDLEQVLARAPRVLVGDEVASISDLADLSTTWPDAPAIQLDTQRLHREFAIVRHQVRSALLRRVLWGVAAFACAYAFAWSTIATLVTTVVHP